MSVTSTVKVSKTYVKIKQLRMLLYTGFPLYFGSEIQALFKDHEVAFSSTNYWRKFTAWTVLQQHL